ncbi:MAG: protein-methionine-sulfoxide reductase catalytic subunit MsrP [Paracoccaceae bacterium]
MRYIRRPRWAISENKTTPEHVFWNRRAILAAGGGLVGLGAAATVFGTGGGMAPGAAAAVPEEPFTPTPARNPAYSSAGRPVTDEALNTTYNNFYEFGSHKRIYEAAQALETDGWTIKIDGMVEKPFEIGVEDLLKEMPIEERIYRHRCVEAWSMVAPWIGFPLAKLIERAQPTSSAKFVVFETFEDSSIARGQRQFWYPWPYTEGVTVAEAMNDLSFMVVGAYGKVLHKQFGAPIRLHLPWKYGFKSIKSIVAMRFTDTQPVSFWENLQASEYGFWANVNPEVSHPRWSQASERVLGTDERVPTELYNGYGPEVAHLYDGMEASLGDRLWR